MVNGICHPPADWSCAYTPEELAALDEATKERAEAFAWTSLWALSGHQISYCPISVRPCSLGCVSVQTWQTRVVTGASYSGVYPGSLGGVFFPHIAPSGKWVNSCPCASPSDCSCSQLCEVILDGPVGGVVEVRLDGAPLLPTAYRVDNGNRLVRTDGECWPKCQDMAADASKPDTFEVTYYRGAAPDILTTNAAGKLAAEFYAACSGKDCALPSGVISLVRQGVSMQLEAGMFPGGKTNIVEVDTLLEIYNPFGLRVPPVISSPERRRARMTTIGG